MRLSSTNNFYNLILLHFQGLGIKPVPVPIVYSVVPHPFFLSAYILVLPFCHMIAPFPCISYFRGSFEYKCKYNNFHLSWLLDSCKAFKLGDKIIFDQSILFPVRSIVFRLHYVRRHWSSRCSSAATLHQTSYCWYVPYCRSGSRLSPRLFLQYPLLSQFL